MSKLPLIIGLVIIIIFFICMKTRETFETYSSPLNPYTGSTVDNALGTPYRDLPTLGPQRLNEMPSDSFYNGSYVLCDKNFNPTNQNIEVVVFKRNYDVLFLVKNLYVKSAIGGSCTSNDDCSTGLCDVDGIYEGCSNKCLSPNRSPSYSALQNCPTQEETIQYNLLKPYTVTNSQTLTNITPSTLQTVMETVDPNQYIEYTNYDPSPGAKNDINANNPYRISKDECKAKCTDDDNCKGYVHRDDNNKCWLKKTYNKMVSRDLYKKYTTGFKTGPLATSEAIYPFGDNKTCNKNNLLLTINKDNVPDLNFCTQVCNKDEDCNYVYQNKNGACQLYSSCESSSDDSVGGQIYKINEYSPTYYTTGTEGSTTTTITYNTDTISEGYSTTFRAYKVVKGTILDNFKTLGKFRISQYKPLKQYLPNEISNVLPKSSEGAFNTATKGSQKIVYFDNNGMRFMKTGNDTYEGFTNYYRDTSNQYHTNIPNIIPPQIKLSYPTDSTYKLEAKHSNNYLLNPILNLEMNSSSQCKVLKDLANYSNVIFFTQVDMYDNQGSKMFKSLGTEFFGPDKDQSSLILETTDLTKFMHGLVNSDNMSSSIANFMTRIDSLQEEQENIVSEYTACLADSLKCSNSGSSSETGCNSLLSSKLYELKNEIDLMELTQWKLKPIIVKDQGVNICTFQFCTMPEYNTLKTNLWAEAHNNGHVGLSLERGGDQRNMGFNYNGKSQSWTFEDAQFIDSNSEIAVLKVKIRSTNGLYLNPSKSFGGFNKNTTKVILSRDSSRYWYILATNLNSSALTVLENNLKLNSLFVTANTNTNNRNSYYCPTSHPTRSGSTSNGYYCTNSNGEKCCLQAGLNKKCTSTCCPIDICPTDLALKSDTECFPEDSLTSEATYCNLTGSKNKCYP